MKFLALIPALLISASAMAQDASPKATFERLKKLEGTWTGIATGDMKVTITYKVTGAGSTLVETQFPGTGHEMITMYHMDGPELVMTHYCAAQNQPSMKYKPGKDGKTLNFDFYKGSNMKPSDMHMHSMKMSILGPDKVESYWTSFSQGKPAGTVSFKMKRESA